MHKIIVTALMPLALLTPLASAESSGQLPAHAAPSVGHSPPSYASPAASAATIIWSNGATTLSYDALLTESNWQRVQLPDEVWIRLSGGLSGLSALTLQVSGLPTNVRVDLSRRSGPAGSVGLKISRTDMTKAVHQIGVFTLTQPDTGEQFSFRAMVVGNGR